MMQPNKQAPQLRAGDGEALRVHSIFHTIQGEGPHAGMPATFIRLAGCNLQCPMCDTDYTTRSMSATGKEVAAKVVHDLNVRELKHRLIVITGGEPFRQDLSELVRELLGYNFRVQVETNGTLFRHGLPYAEEGFDIVCSPKTHRVASMLWPYIRAVKYVGRAEDLCETDGLPLTALGLNAPTPGKDWNPAHKLARPPECWPGEVYLQPVDEQDADSNTRNLNAVVASCLKHGHRLCLQTHKLIGVE